MNPPTSRQRTWSPTTDRSRVVEATSTFTAIDQRSTESPAASRTEEVSVVTEYDPFPSFLDPAKAETEVVISCDDAILQEPARATGPVNLAKPTRNSVNRGAVAQSLPPTQPPGAPLSGSTPALSKHVVAPPPLHASDAHARSPVERALGLRITGTRVAALVGILLAMSAVGSAVALYLVRR